MKVPLTPNPDYSEVKFPILDKRYAFAAVLSACILSAIFLLMYIFRSPGREYIGILETVLLSLVCVLFAPNWSRMTIRYGLLVYVIATCIQFIARRHSSLMGHFTFGEALGPFSNDVGLLLGLPWIFTVFVSYPFAEKLSQNIYIRSLVAALIALVPSLFVLYNSEALGFYTWYEDMPPLRACIVWLVTFYILQFARTQMAIPAVNPVTNQMYVSWLLFQVALFCYRSISGM